MITAVIVDQREPEWCKALTFNGAMVAVELLERGDALIATDDGAMLVVERKTADDLLNSIKDGRLLQQASDLQQHTRWAYLCITGTFGPGPDGKCVTDRGVTGWSWAAVQGVLLTVQELGVFVVHAANDMDYERTLLTLAGRSRNSQYVVPPAKIGLPMSAGEQVLAALPGIGYDRAQAIMAYAGTCAQALEFLTDLEDVVGSMPGIGPGIKKNVRRTLGVPDWGDLSIVMRPDFTTKKETKLNGN